MTRTLVPASTSAPPTTAVRPGAPAPVDRGQQVTGEGVIRAGEVRRATADDVPAMKALIDTFARRNRMLFRSAAELAEFVAEYQVYVEGDAIRGVCGLHPVAGGLAEVRGLAVAEEAAGQGIGRRLVSACVDRARALG